MSLIVTEEHRNHMNLLLSQETPVVSEFCRLATLFLKQEVNPRVFSSAANKLGVSPNQVEEAIQALAFLFLQSAKVCASQTEFKELALSIGFSSDATEAVLNTYIENQEVLREYHKRMGVQVPQYQNLEWRFDILVSSRSLHHIAEPLVTMQFSFNTGPTHEKDYADGSHALKARSSSNSSKNETLLLQTDANNLLHMTTVLEEALQEAHTHHSRRIHRHFK
ncbi:hypothetical protein SK128_014303 [Halocaridina rubra]|uniref:COMM domain-containing protein n=1 Tax=Halocaridina rubra TaxID=373956 RepID=A0AAN8X7C2_HALRR